MGLEEKIERKFGQRFCEFKICSSPKEIKRLQLFKIDSGISLPVENRYQYEALPFCIHHNIARYNLHCRGSQDEVAQRARTLAEQNRLYGWVYFESDITEVPSIMADKCTMHREPEDVKGISLIKYDYGQNVAQKHRYEYTLVAYCGCGKGADYFIVYLDTSRAKTMEHARWLHTDFGLPLPSNTVEVRRSPWLKWGDNPPIDHTGRGKMLSKLISLSRKPKEAQ